MMRSLMFILVILLAAGCQSQAPRSDPFFGRTTIPPPPTGSVGTSPAPNYQAPAVVQAAPQAPASISPPQVQLPAPSQTSSTMSQPSSSAPSWPSWLAPSTSPSAPRPTSTRPGGSSIQSPSSMAPVAGATTTYTPSGGNNRFHGMYSQSAAPMIPTQPDVRTAPSSMTGYPAGRTVGISEDRSPKPLDVAPTGGSAGVGTPIIQTIQPRPKNEASNRVVDIMDLPAANGR